ncbi:hypothetical protein GCM10023094_34100 [Rhodococcus olei]|uniref:Blue (type 1) copper domain-containing protein n=1 Tax=Rhodococcus olei TaxID=2161675 RepID=A0ABP8P716_9NOCA
MKIPAPSRRSLLALGAVGLTLVAGCGTPPAPATAPTVDFGAADGPTPGMDGMSAMPAMPDGANMAAPAPTPAAAPSATNTVQITGFAFAPASITIPVGTTVTWTNSDEEPHTVTAADGAFRSPGMGTGATYAFTFREPGTFDYICTIHPFMHGTVTVTP